MVSGPPVELPSPFERQCVRKEFLDAHVAGVDRNAPEEHDKEVRKCLSGSVCHIRINKYLLASQNI